MARPNKQGVDYFPLDVHVDDKLKFVEIKYKLEGFAVAIKLFQRVYAQGYWCKWTEDELLLFSDEIKAECELVQNVVNECLKRDIFSAEMYEKHEILTSKGIQKRYKEIVRRRKGVEVSAEFLLIDGDFGINDGVLVVNDGINPAGSRQDDGKSTQSKLNKTKEDNKKNTASSSDDTLILEFEDFWNLYKKKTDKKNAFAKFKVARKKHSLEIILNGTSRYMQQCEMKNTERNFIKGPAVFLNGENFNDEFDLSPVVQNGKRMDKLQAMQNLKMELIDDGESKGIGFTPSDRHLL